MRDFLRRVAAALDVEAGGSPAPPPLLEGMPTVGVAGLVDVPGPGDWPSIAAADAPALTGDEAHFVALADRTLIVDEDVPEGSLIPLADEIEETLQPPYRAVAVRKDDVLWAVAAQPVAILDVQAGEAALVEIAVVSGERTCTVDGEGSTERFPELERLGEERGDDFALRAERIEPRTWVVDVWPL